MTRFPAFLLVPPLAMLAACSSGADADGDGEITTAEAAAEAENVNIQPGEWETVSQLTEFEAAGMSPEERDMMSQLMGQPTTQTACITPEQAADPQGSLFTADEGDDCTFSRFDMSGGNVLIDGTCQGEGMPGTMTLHMEGRYTAASYNLTTSMSVDGGPEAGLRMSGTVEGRRIGDCAEGEGETPSNAVD